MKAASQSDKYRGIVNYTDEEVRASVFVVYGRIARVCVCVCPVHILSCPCWWRKEATNEVIPVSGSRDVIVDPCRLLFGSCACIRSFIPDIHVSYVHSFIPDIHVSYVMPTATSAAGRVVGLCDRCCVVHVRRQGRDQPQPSLRQAHRLVRVCVCVCACVCVCVSLDVECFAWCQGCLVIYMRTIA